MDTKKFNFLKKVLGLRNEVLIKTAKTKEGEKNFVQVVDGNFSYMVQSTQHEKVFDGTFGLKNVKAFLKVAEEFDSFEVGKHEIIIKDDTRKFTFRKLLPDTVTDFELPEVKSDGYVNIALTSDDIKEIKTGLKNNLSDYGSLIITSDNKLVLKIGISSPFTNIYEQVIKDIKREDDETEIIFNGKLADLTRLFDSFNIEEEDNKVNIALKPDQPLIVIERNSISNTKYFIALSVDDDDEDFEEDV